ncbi:class I adenylate-forming enzyme family protein [Nocardia sp. alder85J]|uniref:class I adenylate-forming enzyme family protein n=1 Tax=Nocardia sp. alder85J TaxID=2862949 RepID=UPI001CD793E7|nr:class I adenylate-forming enzyme family protein [Nocardia sp. alder85J]MCX4092790.1 class I adenylate-forming enzyme family protein [Nocardia sp. alder85J]
MSPTTPEIRPTIGALLARSVREFGDRHYLISPEERLDYAEADRRSARLARWLLHRGIGKGARVGLYFPNSVEWAVWWLAVSRIGAVAVPLSTLYAPAELAKVLRLADVALLIAPTRVLATDTAGTLETALPDLAAQQSPTLQLPAAPYLRGIVLTGDSDRPWATSPDVTDGVPAELLAAVEAEVSPADPAIMIHTSGSTADPKGVLHTHGTLVRQTATWPAAIRHITGAETGSRILCAMPFFWIGGVLAAMGALHEAVTLLVLPRLEAGAALDLLERERGQGVVGWPAFTQRLRAHPSFPGRDLSSAPTLSGPLDLAMIGVPDGFPVHRSLTESGGSFAHTEVRIVDADDRPVPEGTVGELHIRGVGVMAGYNKRERQEVFDADGWYRTGDRVYRNPGDPRLFYVGRTGDLIKVAGANVSPLEVESVLETFDEIAQCVIVGLEHPARGEEVCAVVVPATGELDLEAVAARARDQLSGYKVPSRWIVTTAERIPTLPSGKLDRRGLRGLVVDGSPK